MTSRAKKYVAVLLVFVCVCMIFSPQTAYAAEDSSQHETVKPHNNLIPVSACFCLA